MKKLYSLLFALLAFAGMASAQVEFDFTGAEAYKLFGFSDFSTGSTHDGDFTEDGVLTSGDVTLTVSPSGVSNANRMWNGSLRMYGGTLTISSTGDRITSITFALNQSKWGSGNTANEGTLETGKWTGDASEVVITISANTQIKSITVNLGGDTPEPPTPPTPAIDWTSSLEAPLTVAQALEKAGQLAGGEQSDVKVYVKGIISRITEIDTQDAQGVPYGNATYYISDDGQEANEFYVFRGKGLNGNNVTSADIKVGDEVVVYGYIQNYVKGETSTLEFTQNNELAAINGQGAPEVEATVYVDIASAKTEATADKTKCVFKANDLLVTHVSGSSVYVFDGTDGLLLYGTNSGIAAGDKISADVQGDLYLYNGLTEISVSAYENLTVNSSGNAVEAQKVTVADVNNNPKQYENELVQIEGLTPAASALENRNIKFTDDSDNELAVRDNWNVLTTTTFNTETEYTVIGFVAIYNDAVQIYPRTAEDVDNGEEPVAYEFQGNGTFENPYSIEDALHLYNDGAASEPVWVMGCVIGAAKSTVKNIINAQGEDLQATNIVLADNAEETDATKVIPVQLPVGKVREALNLVDNFSLLNTTVYVYGTVEKYFSQAGIKNVTDYSLDGETTHINTLNADASKAAIYNIAGQRVSVVGKGLYIVGNKKVLAE